MPPCHSVALSRDRTVDMLLSTLTPLTPRTVERASRALMVYSSTCSVPGPTWAMMGLDFWMSRLCRDGAPKVMPALVKLPITRRYRWV